MITPSFVRTMAAYNAEMNRRLYAAAGRLSDAERRAPKGAFWGSIHGTIVHILWGDSQWMSRFDNWPRPATPIKESDHMIEDFGELCAARDKADAELFAVAEATVPDNGFGYVDYDHAIRSNFPRQARYGIALARPHWMLKLAEEDYQIRVLGFVERGWDDHQDVLVIGKPPIND